MLGCPETVLMAAKPAIRPLKPRSAPPPHKSPSEFPKVPCQAPGDYRHQVPLLLAGRVESTSNRTNPCCYVTRPTVDPTSKSEQSQYLDSTRLSTSTMR